MNPASDQLDLDPAASTRSCQERSAVNAGTQSRPARARHARSPSDNPARRVADKSSPTFWALRSIRDVLMATKNVLILRRPRSGCLEGRTALTQPIVDSFTSSLRVGEDRRNLLFG